MCLCKEYTFPRIALTNKKVYKVVNKGEKGYRTPFRNACVNLGETYKGVFIEGDIISSMFSKIIEDGYIHCFENIESTKSFKFWDIIIECEIPRGTLYWKGINREIATRKLKYLKEYHESL